MTDGGCADQEFLPTIDHCCHAPITNRPPIDKQIPQLNIQNVRLFSGNIGINQTKDRPRSIKMPAITTKANLVSGKRLMVPAPQTARHPGRGPLQISLRFLRQYWRQKPLPRAMVQGQVLLTCGRRSDCPAYQISIWRGASASELLATLAPLMPQPVKR